MALGKTNITTLKEGAIVTEIEDYTWVQQQSGVYGNIIKAIYYNSYLVAITEDGTILYSTDGEIWNTAVLDLASYTLADIAYDGSRFILVGSCEEEAKMYGMIVTTTDFQDYSFKPNYLRNSKPTKFWGIYVKNNKYIVLGFYSGGNNVYYNTAFSLVGDLETWDSQKDFAQPSMRGTESEIKYFTSRIAKNTAGIIAFIRLPWSRNGSMYYDQYVYTTENGIEFECRESTDDPDLMVFENKDMLYYMNYMSRNSYKLMKIINSKESVNVSIDQNYMFVDGVYFNECQLFINHHEMLIVKKGENIADKTVDDLVEIAPESTLNCITKAFGQLYIFGNQGIILKSSTEVNNENTILVQTLSAKQALTESKKYTDERFAALEARIASLEVGLE